MIITRRYARESKAHPAEQGFTLIEVVMSFVILLVGLISLAAVFGISIAATQTSQDDMNAKQLGSEAIESVFTARDTAQLPFSMIQNVSAGGVFQDGFQPILDPGLDGLEGTADDVAPAPPCPGPSRCIQSPGPDGIMGTSDDVYTPLNNYQRQIEIMPMTDQFGNVYPNLRSIRVTVQYTTSKGLQKTYVMNAMISQFR